MRLAENIGHKKVAKKSPSGHHRTIFRRAVSSQRRHVSTIGKNLLNGNISSTCYMSSQYMANFGPLTAEIGPGVWGIPANFNRFHVLPSLLQRRRRRPPEANQTLHDVWSSPGLVHHIHFRGLLPPDGILFRAIFTVRPSLAFSCIGSVTARHSSSRLSQTVAWYKEWNTTFAEGATYIRPGSHQVGHRPTL